MASSTASQYAIMSPLTRSFTHLKRIYYPRFRLRKKIKIEEGVVDARDRIKYWNIVPGDRVRVFQGPNRDLNKVVDVQSVNKYRNMLYMKGLTEDQTVENQRGNFAKPIPYSRVQLYLGEHEFPAKDGSETPVIRKVFATRLSTSKPFWFHPGRYWLWHRFASATVPRLPMLEGAHGRKMKIRIPWPKAEKPPTATQTAYDTSKDDALAVTWVPYPASPSADPHFHILSPATGLTLQDLYIASLREPASHPYDPSLPMEYYLLKELSNPHSRAKKQARWKARLQERESLKEEFVKTELAQLDGRTRAEARREAVWKWKQEVEKRDKDRKRERWVLRGGEKDLERKAERKERKKRRLDVKLRELVLTDAKNQVLPASSRPISSSE